MKNGKLYGGTVTDEHIKSVVSEDLDKKVDKEKILTSYTGAGTTNNLFSANVLVDFVNRLSMNVKTSKYDGDLNDIIENSIYNIQGNANAPINLWGFVITYIHAYANTHGTQIFLPMTSGGDLYLRTKETTWGEWRKVCTSTIQDKTLTQLDVSNISNYSKGSIYYQIKNGIAYVQIYDLLTTNTINTAINIYGLPSPNMYAHTILENMGVIRGIISCPQGGTAFSYYKASDDATLGGYCSFSYPVATN